jgi:hypothetical protein
LCTECILWEEGGGEQNISDGEKKGDEEQISKFVKFKLTFHLPSSLPCHPLHSLNLTAWDLLLVLMTWQYCFLAMLLLLSLPSTIFATLLLERGRGEPSHGRQKSISQSNRT